MKRGHLRLAECRQVNLALKTPSLALAEAAMSQSKIEVASRDSKYRVISLNDKPALFDTSFIFSTLQIKHQAFTHLAIVLALCLAR